jgi:uncharacterized protein (UPF0216 family)
MSEDSRYDRLLQESLKEELRFLNAPLPGKRKSLGELLKEETPSVTCADGSLQIFKRKELEYLSGLTDEDARDSLLLPVIIEVEPGRNRMAIICHSDAEQAVFSALLGMTLTEKNHRIVIHKPQLAAIRKVLKTTTQYLFSPKILQ